MAFQDERANHYYTKAFAELPVVDRKSQRTGLIMAAITMPYWMKSGWMAITSLISASR